VGYSSFIVFIIKRQLRVAVWLLVKVRGRVLELRSRMYVCFVCDTQHRCSSSILLRLVELYKS